VVGTGGSSVATSTEPGKVGGGGCSVAPGSGASELLVVALGIGLAWFVRRKRRT